ncbi:MAG: hypothetical protein ACE5I3_15775, partial [Phycisphaerae bacterium]
MDEPSQAAHMDVRSLPAQVTGLPERVEWRTPNSATFEAGEGRYSSVVYAGPVHYRDANGDWQVINPAFQTGQKSFYVQRNSIRSRAGLRSAWLSAAVGDAALRWQATSLGAASASGDFAELAHALAEPSQLAEMRENGRLLHYAGGWSDPSLVEEISSAPGSVEHQLILAGPPRADGGTPDFLELRATLELLPDATLWADGQQQSGAFRTVGALEVHDKAGRLAIIIDPVRAFEQAAPQVAVAGEYVVSPGDKPGQWTVAVRTPWTWWRDPQRRYPAIIDPTMHVLRTTGNDTNGLAWVSDPNHADTDNPQPGFFQLGSIVVGAVNNSANYRGYLQFNAMPAVLTNHPPMKVETATLEIAPHLRWMPAYRYDADEGPSWKNLPISHPVRLESIDNQICTDPIADPHCFSLIDNRLANTTMFNWDNRPTISTNVPNGTLTIGPFVKGAPGEISSFDVTQAVRDWYDKSPRPNHGPAFVLVKTDNSCPKSHSFLVAQNEIHDPPLVPLCTTFGIAPGEAQLLITYTAMELHVGNNLLNQPGVPSYFKDTFADTNHLYDLVPPAGPARWRAVAVRGNHDIAASTSVSVTAGVNVKYQKADSSLELLAEGGTFKEETSYVFIDGH